MAVPCDLSNAPYLHYASKRPTSTYHVSFRLDVVQRHDGEVGVLCTVVTQQHLQYADVDLKVGLYRIWCGMYTLGDRHSAIDNPAGQLLLTIRVSNS